MKRLDPFGPLNKATFGAPSEGGGGGNPAEEEPFDLGVIELGVEPDPDADSDYGEPDVGLTDTLEMEEPGGFSGSVADQISSNLGFIVGLISGISLALSVAALVPAAVAGAAIASVFGLSLGFTTGVSAALGFTALVLGISAAAIGGIKSAFDNNIELHDIWQDIELIEDTIDSGNLSRMSEDSFKNALDNVRTSDILSDRDKATINAAIDAAIDSASPQVKPIIIDLNADGIEVDIANSIAFDWDDDGYKEIFENLSSECPDWDQIQSDNIEFYAVCNSHLYKMGTIGQQHYQRKLIDLAAVCSPHYSKDLTNLHSGVFDHSTFAQPQHMMVICRELATVLIEFATPLLKND
ncbi:MAG: hypothetical protein AAGB04_29065, partial [Pseudomonadota bacterium]